MVGNKPCKENQIGLIGSIYKRKILKAVCRKEVMDLIEYIIRKQLRNQASQPFPVTDDKQENLRGEVVELLQGHTVGWWGRLSFLCEETVLFTSSAHCVWHVVS